MRVLPFDDAVVNAPDFVAADGQFKVHTRWIETDFAETLAQSVQASARPAPLPGTALTRTAIEVNGKRVSLGLPAALLGALAGAAGAGQSAVVLPADEAVAPGAITAPSSGTLQKWLVDEGSSVKAGEPVAVMEAMKMEMQVAAPCDGVLAQSAAVGASLRLGAVLGVVKE